MQKVYRSFGLVALAVLLTVRPADCQSASDVRVKLFDHSGPTVVTVSAVDGPVLLYAGSFVDEIARVEVGDTATLSRAGNQLHVDIGANGLFAIDLRIEPSQGAQIALAVEEGTSPLPSRAYQGRVFVAPGETAGLLQVINEVDLDDYVAAVVAAEYGFDDLEGAKAMAVIIRTYTLAVLDKYGTEFDHVDHTLSQVYHGTERITSTIRKAVRQTRGQILTYDGEPIDAVYFAASGGHTADNETVWNAEALPYLRGKPDPYGLDAPDAEWTFRVPRARLLSALSETYGSITGFTIENRGKDDRVTSINLLKVTGRTRSVTGNEFRLQVMEHFGATSLRSTLFTAELIGEDYVFDGKGKGHGVGLSQWGARDLALQDASYEDILYFYYTDVRLESAGDAPLAEKNLPSAQVRESEEFTESGDRGEPHDYDVPVEPPAASSQTSRRIGW